MTDNFLAVVLAGVLGLYTAARHGLLSQSKCL